jgi:hypothetical protein
MRVVLYILCIFTLLGCATKRERAHRHIDKAIALYPKILNEISTPIKIDTQIIYQKEIIIEERVDSSKQYTKIDLQRILDSLGRSKDRNTQVILENERLKVELRKTAEGWYDFVGTSKPDTIEIFDTVRIEILREIPVKVLEQKVEYKKGYFYWTGVMFNLFMIIAVGIFIWRALRR